MDEKALRGMAFNMLPQFPRQVQLDDLIQEGRIALWKVKEKIPTDPQHAKRFCAQVAKFAMLDWVRYMWPARGNAGRIVTYSADDNVEMPLENAEEITPLDHAQARQAIEQLETRVVGKAAALRLQVLALLIEGHEGKDIAKMLGVAAETVSLHKTELRKLIGEFI